MRSLDGGHVEIDTEARPIRQANRAGFDAQRLLREPLAVLPDPVRVDGGDAARRRGGYVSEHGERNVEVVVRVRPPREAPVAAGLRNAHGSGQRPEMRVGERDVDGLQRQRMAQLAPVGRDHVGGRRQAGGTAELGHHLAARIAAFGAARVFGVGQHGVLVAHQPRGLGQRPGAVRVERDARLRKALVQGRYGLDLGGAAQYATLELEVGEAVARFGRFGQPHDGPRVERGLVAQTQPAVGRRDSGGAIAERALRAVADEEQVAEHRYRRALHAIAEQRGHGQTEVLAEQIEQRALDAGGSVDGAAQIERLCAATVGIPVGVAVLHLRHETQPVAHPLADDEGRCIFDHARNRLPAGHFADAGTTCGVGGENEVAGEVRAVCAAQVEQHAVVARDRDDAQRPDSRRVDAGTVTGCHRTTRIHRRPVRLAPSAPRVCAARGCSPGGCERRLGRPRCRGSRSRRGSNRAPR